MNLNCFYDHTQIEQSMKTALMNSDIEVASSVVSIEILSNNPSDPDSDIFVSEFCVYDICLKFDYKSLRWMTIECSSSTLTQTLLDILSVR